MRSDYRSERHAALEAHYPACRANACKSGRSGCPAPQACLMPEEDVSKAVSFVLFLMSLLLLTALGVHIYFGWFA